MVGTFVHLSDIVMKTGIGSSCTSLRPSLRSNASYSPLSAVTLMSSDMGKLYAALAQAIDRRR